MINGRNVMQKSQSKVFFLNRVACKIMVYKFIAIISKARDSFNANKAAFLRNRRLGEGSFEAEQQLKVLPSFAPRIKYSELPF